MCIDEAVGVATHKMAWSNHNGKNTFCSVRPFEKRGRQPQALWLPGPHTTKGVFAYREDLWHAVECSTRQFHFR